MQYCPKCGARNEDGIAQCAGCGASFSQFSVGPQGPQAPQPPQGPQVSQDSGYRPPKPDNYLIWAILSTVLCCLPAGIVSIVFSAKVDSLYYAGNYAAARDSANKAKTWAIVSAAVGLVAGLGYFVLIAIGMLSGAGM